MIAFSAGKCTTTIPSHPIPTLYTTPNITMNLIKSILLTSCLATFQAFAGSAPTPVGKGTPNLPPPGCAGPITYSNIHLNYGHTELDDDSLDNLDGISLELEYAIIPHLFLTGAGSWATGDSDDLGDVNIWDATAGLGSYVSLCSHVDLVVDAGGVWSNYDSDQGDSNDSGWYVRPHLRSKFSCLELHAGAKFISFGSGSDEETWEGFTRAFYEVAPQLDLAATFAINEDAYTLTAGVRYRF